MKSPPIFGYRIDRAIKALRLDLNQRFKRNNIDITPEQWLVMNKLAQYPAGLSQSEIADNTYKDAPTTSRIIDLLCKKGFTERKPFVGDRRRHQVYLTSAGLDIVDIVTPEVEENRKIGWHNLDQNDYEVFVRIIDQIYDNYRANNS